MALSIKIGTGSNIYTDVAQAFANRGNQKLSIVGTGADILTNITALKNAAGGIGSIKALSDVTMDAATAASNKAAILKFGTKSLVVNDTALAIGSNYTALDSVYNKTKSLVSDGVVTISADQLTLATNLNGIENLVGRGTFTVTAADAADFKQNLNALVANASKINTITMTTETGTMNFAQFAVLGGKMGALKAVVSDTADNLLSSGAIAAYTANAGKIKGGGLNVTKATIAQVSQIDTLVTATTFADAKMGDTVIQDTATALNNSNDLAGAITKAKGWKAGAATVSKVIIDGTNAGVTTKAVLDSIKTKASGVVVGGVTFQGKALDIEKNLSVLVDNLGGASAIGKITVTDGSFAAKKQFTVTMAQYTALNAAFTSGQADSGNTNYGYNVTGAGTGNIAALQGSEKVTSFTVIGLAAGDSDSAVELVPLLGNSKMKTVTIASGYTTQNLTYTRTALSTVSSNTDKAKLKFIA
jgi:hypothetical protein